MRPQNAESARLTKELARENTVFFPLVSVWSDLFFDERADRDPKLIVLFLEGGKHRKTMVAAHPYPGPSRDGTRSATFPSPCGCSSCPATRRSILRAASCSPLALAVTRSA